MVEIIDQNGLQVRKVKCRRDYRAERWGRKCQCCRRGFTKGQIRYDWRLTVPFQKPWTWGNGNYYFQKAMMNWTTHCRACFQLTGKAMEQKLSKVIDIAKM
jgi:hypothetical protein